MKPHALISRSSEETIQFGADLAKQCQGGDIICLFGDLGAGKTTLVKGLAQGLGVEANEVSSPTFVLMNIYEGRLSMYHFDLYRIDPSELLNIGYEEFFFGEGLCVVEWSERLGELMPSDYIKVELSHQSEDERQIECSMVGEKYKERSVA